MFELNEVGTIMSDTTVLYGIKNCDTVKKAREWLEEKGIQYRFHDFRADGLSKDRLQLWLTRVGSKTLINNRSTTWKQLTEKDQKLAMGTMASAAVLANPTLIKRPVLEHDEKIVIGFSPEDYEKLF
jgi:arsenate reductase (glutaredoxin)